MRRNINELHSYECHMISDKVLLGVRGTFINRLSLFLFLSLLSVSTVVLAQSPVASFTVSSSQGCAPFQVQFTNTSQGAVSFQWNFGNGNTSTQTSPGNVFTSAGTYTVSLTATNAGGASNVYSMQITVYPKPSANFAVSQNAGCQGSQVFSFQNLSASFDSCIWDFGDGTTSNQLNPQHIYTISGTFNVTLVAYNKLYGCSDVKVIPGLITVYPSPSAIISVNDTSTCNPSYNFQFSAILSNAVSFTWFFGDGTQSSAASPSHIYADTGYYNISLVMTSANGCTDTVYANRLVHIKWNPVPVVSISADSGCVPHYVAMVTSNNLQANYNWNLGNGVTRNSSAVYYTYSVSGIYPVTLTASYPGGCQQVVNAGNISVFDRPTFTYSMTNNNGCAPLAVQFINNNAGANYTWLWDFGDGSSSSQAIPSHTYSAPGIYQVSLTATSPAGCTNGYPLNDKVRVYAPVAAFTSDVTSGCPPLTVNFTNNSSGASVFFWDFGDGTTSTVQHPAHIYQNAGSYTVTLIVTDATGCSDTLVTPTAYNVAQAVVNYVPPPTFTGCAPYPVNFSDASGAASYLWDFGDGTTSTAANPYHIYTEPGTYVVALTTWMINGGCEQHIPNFQTFIIDGAEPGFTYTVSPCPPYEVYFTDTSLNAASWSWTFGDGGTAGIQHPSHSYPGPGTYNVVLTVTTPGGCVTTLQANNAVQITGLGASASAICADSVPPLNVQFYANSTAATWWAWSFGDGDSSSLQDPLHVYSTAGPFSVTLTVGNDSCVYTYIYPPLSFGSSFGGGGGGLGGDPPPPPPRVYHCAPYTVNFTNPDPFATSWLWHFGDGVTSTLPSPEHVYSDSGAYIPVLYLYYTGGVVDSIVYSDTFFVVEPLTDFDIATTNLCNGVIVDVQTTAYAQSYDWDFGNGLTFNTPTASVTYPNVNASYMVSLHATDTNNCSSFIAKSFAVNATSPLSANTRRACAGDSILFDPGNVNYVQYNWSFGDGSFSNSRNAVHAYQDSGLYAVSLEVTDINGCQLIFNMAYQIEIFDPLADFSLTIPQTNCSTVFIGFNNLSTGSNSWFWTFGDGSSSNQFEPSHTYSILGYHDITLTAFKNVCSNSKTISNAVYVSNMIPAFTYNAASLCVPAPVTFSDMSIDAVKWHWDFGDGDTSSLQNPTHIYQTSPLDSITLTVTDVNGCVKSLSLPSPQITSAGFSVLQDGGCVPFNVVFVDSSVNVAAWNWNFGDNQTSNLPAPVHSYLTDGFYTVSLIVTSSTGCTDTLVVDSLIEVNTPVADFIADSLSGCSPLLVGFQDQSINAVTWSWNFGNGSSSGNQMPALIYTGPGYYDVTLSIENKFGCMDSLTRDSLIHVQGPSTSFNVSATSGCAPLTVSFINTSSGAVSWDWSFGDGSSDTVETPVHTFTDPGSFTVSLFAYDSIGCSTNFTFPVPVETGLSPTASFTVDLTSGCSPLTIQLDNSQAQADSLIWNMGNGTFLYGNNPSYTYTQAGDYVLSLVAYNSEGCTDTLVYADTIHVYQQPLAGFVANETQGCMPAEISFLNQSSGLSNAVFEWSFGNGDISNVQDPQYLYNTPGLYGITLIVVNDNACSDTLVRPDYITIFDQNPPPVTDMYRVTVNSPGEVFMEWPAATVNDLDYYTIYRYNSITTAWDSLNQVFQTFNGGSPVIPFYTDTATGINTLNATYSYKIQAVDKCGMRQNLSALNAHETILLNAVGGHQQLSLSWSRYGGCSITAYEIYRKDLNNGSFQLIATVDSATLSYIDTTAGCPVPYFYKVMALDICGDPAYASSSNEASATPSSDVEDQFVDIVRSTVVDDKYVLTEWGEPAVLPYLVDRYDIYRSTDKVNYQLIATVPNTAHEYSDMDVRVDDQEYYYKVIVQNICNVNAKEGLMGSSILLQRLEMGSDYILKWTKYLEWNTGVETFVIEKLNSNGSWEEIERLPGSFTEWEEK